MLVSEYSFISVMIVCGGGLILYNVYVLNVRYNGITNVTSNFTTKECR